MKTTSRFLLAALVAAWTVANVRANVEYSSFDPGDTFSPNMGNVVVGSNPPLPVAPPQVVAGEFTASFTGMLSSVDVALSANPFGGDQHVTLSLALNNPLTNLPISTTEISLGTLTATATNGSVVSLSVGTPVPLLSGTAYWLVLAPAASSSIVAWPVALTTLGPTAASGDGGTTFTAGTQPVAEAFRINAAVTGAPEPSTWAMLGVGMGAAVWRAASARRRRAA